MGELETILRRHAARYPLMEPRDAVKLLYQNEFGPAHMIADESACREALRKEYAAVPRNEAALCREDIGGGLVRVHLAALSPAEAETLADDFLVCAETPRGGLDSFRAKLRLLTALAESGIFSFSPRTLAAFLAEYEAAGFPSLSHSEAYRSAYRPAYRVVFGSGE